MNEISSWYRDRWYIRLSLFALVSIVMGVLWFVLLFDWHRLALSNVNWIYAVGGDAFQHQLGWEWFRQEPWQFPLGHISDYGYPYGTSLSFLDSIPLFAIPFKILSPLFRERCQYLGVWMLFSMIGQLFFGMLIINEIKSSFLTKVLGSSLLVLSPILIFKAFVHDSLTAHWIILAAIWLLIAEYRKPIKRYLWALLFAVSMLIHMYFIAFLLPFWLVHLFFGLKQRVKKLSLIIEILSVIGVVILLGFVLGLNTVDFENLGIPGFGFYSWNANSWINPMDTSAFMKNLPTGVLGQYEGYSYLGLGYLIILIVGIVLYFQTDSFSTEKSFIIPLLLISGLLILYALSNKAFLNNTLIWDIELPDFLARFFSLFRASGRFIWPVFYLLIIFGLLSCIRKLRHPEFLLLFALLVQFVDIRPLYLSKRTAGFFSWHSPLQSNFWDAASSSAKHIVFLERPDISYYEPIALFARQNKLTLNDGYFARANYDKINADTLQTLDKLNQGIADPKSIYIFPEEFSDADRELLITSLVYCQFDDYEIVLSKDNQIIETNPALWPECNFPK